MEKLTFTGMYQDNDNSLGYKGISVPNSIMEIIKKMANKRFIIRLNDFITYPGTAIPIEKDNYVILINKARYKKLGKGIHNPIKVELTEDTSEFGMPLPEEFQEVLQADPEGEAYLRALTPGKIRSLIYLVAKVKNPDKRIEKSVVILEHLRANKGVLDHKMLNIAFKEYNKR